MAQKMKTPGQNRRIFGLKAELGLEHDDLRELAFLVSDGKRDRVSDLTFRDAETLIKLLESKLPKKSEYAPRTIQYKRQQKGLLSEVTPTHLDEMRRLWRLVEGRTPEGLQALTRRIIRFSTPRTSSECNKVIEAIKAMNKRAQEKAKEVAA
jgi:hypothetical protein